MVHIEKIPDSDAEFDKDTYYTILLDELTKNVEKSRKALESILLIPFLFLF